MSLLDRTFCPSADWHTPGLWVKTSSLRHNVLVFELKFPNQYHLNTQDRTSSLPPSSGCNNTLASQNWSSLRRPSRNAGRKRARAAFGGRVGSEGRREYYVRRGSPSQTRNDEENYNVDLPVDFSSMYHATLQNLSTVSKYALLFSIRPVSQVIHIK